jgi:hypothetical protein
MRTAVRFREGKIYAPIAFTGSYNPPLIGCVQFSGWAETNIELQFDQQRNRLVGHATILNVSLNGTGGIGGSLVAKLVQNAIDRKVNPVEILDVGRLSFLLPVKNSNNLRMQATGVTYDVAGGQLNVHVQFAFLHN